MAHVPFVRLYSRDVHTRRWLCEGSLLTYACIFLLLVDALIDKKNINKYLVLSAGRILLVGAIWCPENLWVAVLITGLWCPKLTSVIGRNSHVLFKE